VETGEDNPGVPIFIVKKLVEKLDKEKRSRQLGKRYALVFLAWCILFACIFLVFKLSSYAVNSIQLREWPSQKSPFDK